MSPKQAGPFVLEIPIDLSQVAAEGGAQELRVVARAHDGALTSGTVTGEASGRATASLAFADNPGPLQIMVGPASATETQLVNLQTISVNVPGATWAKGSTVAIDPIAVAPYYWWWWLEWCRRFIIRGRVTCADGSPVPGATVCAYDLDWWFWWTSTELLGCATTDINGAFEIDFTWCCGWWPWWWWQERRWQVSPELVRMVSGVLEQDPRIKLGRSGLLPSLSPFSQLAQSRAVTTSRLLTSADVPAVAQLRQSLDGQAARVSRAGRAPRLAMGAVVAVVGLQPRRDLQGHPGLRPAGDGDPGRRLRSGPPGHRTGNAGQPGCQRLGLLPPRVPAAALHRVRRHRHL